MIRQLVYRSRESYPMATEDMIRLLLAARDYNRQAGITGMLLLRDGVFMQLLEGDPDEVLRLYRHIGDDARHHDVELLLDRTVATRLLPGWSMGYAHAPATAEGRDVFLGLRSEARELEILARAPQDDRIVCMLRGFLSATPQPDQAARA